MHQRKLAIIKYSMSKGYTFFFLQCIIIKYLDKSQIIIEKSKNGQIYALEISYETKDKKKII